MEKAFTKEQLLEMVRIIDKYFLDTDPIFTETEELLKKGVPDEFREDWEDILQERRINRNLRFLFARDLKINHGIEV